VLLIIFMVLKQAMVNEVTARVPPRSQDPAPSATRQIVLAVKAGGALTLDDRPVTPQSLPAEIAARLRGDRDGAVFFQIDDAVPYADAVRVMDLVKGAGARVLAVVTRD
jgi:biopolymer transport protein ExbD